MTAPNIVNVITITGKTATLALPNTNATTLINNPASSGKVFKINLIQVANVDGTNACNVTVKIHPEANGGGTGRHLLSTVSVGPDSTLIATDKATSFYLEENESVTVTAGTANDLEVVASFEEIS